MRHASTVGWVTGPLVLAAYLLGSLRHLATALRHPHDATRATAGGRAEVVDVAVALVAATVAWHVTRSVAPGVTLSRVASLSNQVLFVWQSVALWCGLAAVVGAVAPVWTRFRGGGAGLVPALALAAVHVPVVFGVGAVAYLGGAWLTRSFRTGVVVALAAAVAGSWWAWVLDLHPAWGATNGPEVSLWVTATAGVLGVRWWQGDVLADPGAAPHDPSDGR